MAETILDDATVAKVGSLTVGPAKVITPPAGPLQTVRADVVIPFSQSDERFLPQTIPSVIYQNAAQTHVHLIADGFQPGEFVREVARTQKEVSLYVNDEPVGPYISTMRIFDHLRHEHFVIQDSDDLAEPNRVWWSVTQIERYGVEAYAGAMTQFIDHSSQGDPEIQRKLRRNPTLHSSLQYKDNRLLGIHAIHGASTFRKSAFETMNGFAPMFCAGDSEFWIRSFARGFRYFLGPEIVASRRLHGSSLTGSRQTGIGSPIRAKMHGMIAEHRRRLKDGATDVELGSLHLHRSNRGTERLA